LKFLFLRAKDKNTIETPVKSISEIFSYIAASESHVVKVLSDLYANRLIKTIDAKNIDINSTVVITLSGGYYYNFLSKQFEYLETIMFDTPIFIDEFWEQLYSINETIQFESNIVEKVKLRTDRILIFFDYMKAIEEESINNSQANQYAICGDISRHLHTTLKIILKNATKIYG
jgi:hypothetical protein